MPLNCIFWRCHKLRHIQSQIATPSQNATITNCYVTRLLDYNARKLIPLERLLSFENSRGHLACFQRLVLCYQAPSQSSFVHLAVWLRQNPAGPLMHWYMMDMPSYIFQKLPKWVHTYLHGYSKSIFLSYVLHRRETRDAHQIHVILGSIPSTQWQQGSTSLMLHTVCDHQYRSGHDHSLWSSV